MNYNKTLLAIFLIMFFIPLIQAYDSNYLKAYYSMENTNQNTSIIIDSQGHYNLSNNNHEYCVLSQSGKILNTTFYGSCASPSAIGHNATIQNFTSEWSINYWLNFSNSNIERFIGLSNPNEILNSRYTATNNFTIYNTTTTLIQYNSLMTNWHMITYTYDNTNTLRLYIDGVYINSKVYTIPSGTDKLMLGYPFGSSSMIDELSIFDSEITVFDAVQLYNLGNGLNYNQTIANTQTNTTPLCIDDYNLCNNVIVIGSDYYCSDVLNTLYCGKGCTNILINNTLTGQCNLSDCINECNIIGFQECDSSTSFKICNPSNIDTCLHYNTGYSCMIGQYCNNGYCYTLNQSKTIVTNPNFNVVPYQNNSIGTTYTYNQDTKTLNVISSQIQLNEGFAIQYINQVTYNSISCNYKENLTFSDNTRYNINASQTYNTPIINNPYYINISFLIANNSNSTIQLKNLFNEYYENITFYRNSTEKSLRMYINNTLYFTDLSVNSYDDLQSIDIQIKVNPQTKSFTLTITPVRIQSSTYVTSTNLFYPQYSEISNIIISTNDFMNITSLNIYEFTQTNGFIKTVYNDYNKLRCTYTTTGCTVNRIYLNSFGYPDYTNYKDINVCIQKLSASSSEIYPNIKPITQGQQIFIFLIVLVVMFTMFFIVGYVLQMQKVFVIIGIIFDIFLLFLASLPKSFVDIPLISGIIPLWITIMIGLIAIVLGLYIVIRPQQRE